MQCCMKNVNYSINDPFPPRKSRPLHVFTQVGACLCLNAPYERSAGKHSDGSEKLKRRALSLYISTFACWF